MIVLLNAISDGVASFDEEFRYTFLTESILERIGRPKEEMLGKKLFKPFPDIV